MQAQIPGRAAAKKPGARHDPVYVDLTVRRWKRFTEKQATPVEDSRAFDEIAAAGAD